MPNILITWFRFWKTVAHRFIDDGCSYRAAALSYTLLLSIVPLMMVSLSVVAIIPFFKNFSQPAQDFIFTHFLPASGRAIQNHLQALVVHLPKLSIIGSIFLFITAILMMFNVEQAFNVIWQIKTRRNDFYAFLLYWAVLTLAPIFIVISFAISVDLASVTIIERLTTEFGLTKLFIAAAPFIVSILTFTVIYIVIPNCYVPFRNAFFGAILASILLEAAKKIFTLYIKHFSNFELIYGALSAIPVFLIWLYLSWLIILFGAVVSNVLTIKPGVSDES